MKTLLAIVCLGTLLVSAPAVAQPPDNMTDVEVAVLPNYCRDTWGFKFGPWSPDPKWLEIMGQGFMAMHHYCWALIKLTRAEKPGVPPVAKLGYREAALGDLYFVVKNSPRDFILLPEIYTKIGTVQILLKRYLNASESFATARSLKPDYWPAYFHWAEYLRQSGQKAKAKTLVEEALSYSPEARPLQNLFVALGGDPSSIQPRHRPPAVPAPEPSAGASAPQAH